ncbi:HpcH/HpaI aldolase/citrate lyase family protein [Phenylobacterium deserti]|uniref:CoA ester lyase n=1 Tax=Phenylobacterium deserti TaxID=1914756 RepID=A0A328AQZ0_9CAUL|nr:CoA ester lyase [Phenylobacterium deserti]RAK57443.1 CoA ester lyase [Phenylobacterium deserti]
MLVRPRRSALYLPATNARALEKARTLSCDVVVLDLEDSIAPEAKAEARLAACEAVRAGGFGARELVVRINALDTPWGAADLGAVAGAQPDALLVPKLSDPEDLPAYAAALGGKTRLWGMIETCKAVLRLDALGAAAAANRMEGWILGLNDLAMEMGCRPGADRAPLQAAMSLAVTAARAHGLFVLDAVYNDFSDAEGLARECAQGVAFGFDGKSLIHPAQIAAANAAFSPDPEALAWARQVVRAFDAPESAGRGVIKVDGKMVERLHLEQAQRLIALSDAIAVREGSPE